MMHATRIHRKTFEFWEAYRRSRFIRTWLLLVFTATLGLAPSGRAQVTSGAIYGSVQDQTQVLQQSAISVEPLLCGKCISCTADLYGRRAAKARDSRAKSACCLPTIPCVPTSIWIFKATCRPRVWCRCALFANLAHYSKIPNRSTGVGFISRNGVMGS
jgi:hypothetical protein